jgi:outer membrane receptor protein involved in Fe transport
MGEEMRKNKPSPVVFVKKPTFVATQVALAVMAQLAYAQQPVQTAERVERVEITGSRIPMIEAEGPSPVTVMTAQEIRLDGLSKTEDLLNNLPQVFAAQGSNATNGATGTAQVSLRGLGPTRNLVLVNGRRLPPGSPNTGGTGPYAPDLNQIPAPLIQRVEVLTGGASAVYGSDAISGVVNFIMNDRFEGLQVDLYHSFYNHHQQNPNGIADIIAGRSATNPAQFKVPGDVNDGTVNGVSMIMGRNFADNKGNATLFFGYKKEGSIPQAARDFSACALNAGASFQRAGCGGSGTSATGKITAGAGAGTAYTLDQASNSPRTFSNSTDLFNFAPYQYYRRPSEQFNLNAFAHLDINSKVRAYGEIAFHDYHTDAVIGPSGIFGSIETLHGENPLITPAWKGVLGLGGAGTTADTLIQKRNIEGGGRDDDLRLSSYRGVVGFKGDLSKAWSYDAYLQHGKVLYQEVYRNDFSKVRASRALDVISDPVTGRPACRTAVNGTDPNCVPYNIWSVGGITQAALDYVQTPGLANGRTEQTIYGATFQADLGNYGMRMPGAKNGVAVVVGAERRNERLNYDTDVAFSTFDLAGQGGPIIGIRNKSLGAEEIFGEARIPLIEGKPLAQSLSLSASARRSNYTTNKQTDTYGFGAEWAPIKPVRLRGTYQHAVRHANIVELFQANGANLFELTQDPCGPGPAPAAGGPSPGPTATAAQCARTGVTPAQYGSPVLFNPAGQYNFLQGGNSDLKPETANTWTLGAVLQPLRNLTATIDWWNIKIDDAIGNPPPETVLTQCLNSGQFCNLVRRDATGTLWLPGGGQIVATNINLAHYQVQGIDFGASYNQRIGAMGSFGVNFNGSYLQKWEYEPFKGLGTFDCAGLYGSQCGTTQTAPNPKWRHKLRGSWLTPWNLDLALTWRHIDSVKFKGTSSDPLLRSTTPATDENLAARDYFDVAALWVINKTFSMRAGVNNIFDKDPPVVSNTNSGVSIGGNGNTFPQTYDALGRLMFMNLTMKF